MVGRLLSFWDGIFSGAMLNFQGVRFLISYQATSQFTNGRSQSNDSPYKPTPQFGKAIPNPTCGNEKYVQLEGYLQLAFRVLPCRPEPRTHLFSYKKLRINRSKHANFSSSFWVPLIDARVITDYLWTPKPWKMKVLGPQDMGHNPKKWRCWVPMVCQRWLPQNKTRNTKIRKQRQAS